MHRFRFLHIPKCAGITFATVLRLQYLGKPHFSFSGEFAVDRRRWEGLSPARRQRIRLFTGHAPIETGIPEADNDIEIVTMLREPVSRVKSFCQHVFEGKSPQLLERFPPDRFDLDEFLDSGNEGLSNLQTKMLINSGTAASSELLSSMTEDAARTLALRNLNERISCYGIQEFFDESLVRFQQRFGWRTPCYASSNQSDPGRFLKFEARHLAAIIEMNGLDIAVYEAARKIFLEQIESSAFDRGRLRRLRTIQPLVSPAVQALITMRSLFEGRRAS